MRKLFFFALVLLILGSMNGEAGAWVFVPDQGDTGWQTYTYVAGSGGFIGIAGFVVSNVVDNSAFSELLLDNFSQGGGESNRGFEAGNFSNFNLLGDSYAEVTATSVWAISGNEYLPVEGDFMSHQFALGPGVNTAAFSNAYGQPGTIGSILETSIFLAPEETFSFSWAFLGNDFSPWNDFSLFYLKNPNGEVVFIDGLGQIGPAPAVPLPPSVLLLGSGLLALLGLGLRSRKPYEGSGNMS
jgi:hypothetical protein